MLQRGNKWLTEGNGLANISSSSRCGADSFMIRDGVCDEATNIEVCLFDGGDCCLEQKNEELCGKCICKMGLDLPFIQERFEEADVQMFVDKGQFRKLIQMRAKMVQDVQNVNTCSMLCLNDDMDGKINSWLFNHTSRACKCTWINTIVFLIHDIGAPVKDNKTVTDALAVIQMSKQFTSGLFLAKCSRSKTLFTHLTMLSTDLAVKCIEINAMYKATTAVKIGTLKNELSPTACKEACQSAGNCTFFSWNSNGKMCMH